MEKLYIVTVGRMFRYDIVTLSGKVITNTEIYQEYIDFTDKKLAKKYAYAIRKESDVKYSHFDQVQELNYSQI